MAITPLPMPNDSPPSAADLRAETAVDRAPGQRSRLGWTAAVLAFALVLLFGSVPAEAGPDTGEVARITALWAQMTGLLERRGLPASVVVVFWGAAVFTMLATVGACWLAQTVRQESDREDRGM